MINWTNIKQSYPKAWKKLIRFHTKPEFGLVDNPNAWDLIGIEPWELRHLFDFFDEEGVYLNVGAEPYQDGVNWLWQIVWLEGGTGLYGDNGEYLSRSQAEVAAIERAFELLEEKI